MFYNLRKGNLEDLYKIVKKLLRHKCYDGRKTSNQKFK